MLGARTGRIFKDYLSPTRFTHERNKLAQGLSYGQILILSDSHSLTVPTLLWSLYALMQPVWVARGV